MTHYNREGIIKPSILIFLSFCVCVCVCAESGTTVDHIFYLPMEFGVLAWAIPLSSLGFGF